MTKNLSNRKFQTVAIVETSSACNKNNLEFSRCPEWAVVWETYEELQQFYNKFVVSIVLPLFEHVFVTWGTLIRFILTPLDLLSVTQGRGELRSLLCPPAGAIPSIGDFTTIYNNVWSPPPISAKRVFQPNPFHRFFI